MSRGWVRAAAMLTALAVAVTGPATAALADTEIGEPISLPSVTDECVGAAPTRAGTAPWAQQLMMPQLAWPLTRGGGVLVAVVDTGVSAKSPALAGAVLAGQDVVRPGPANTDCFGRGTAMAGIVAGRPVTGSPFVGMAPAAQVLPIRVVDEGGRMQPDAIAAGIAAATGAGAKVILVGTGVATTTATAALRAAVDAALARDIVVVAAVNEEAGARQQTAVWYPAGYQAVIAVAGVDDTGTYTGTVAPEVRVDLVGPGRGSISVGPVGDGHYAVGGAAVAAAYVAGAAALVRAHNPALSPAGVRERLIATAEQPTNGSKLVDPYAAVAAVAPKPLVTVTAGEPGALTLPGTPPSPVQPRAAGTFAAAAIGAVLVATLALVIARRGARRRWRSPEDGIRTS